jgi:opacity protein-like surface antigen
VASVPVSAWAQAGWYLTPRLSLAEEYNDNITFQQQKVSDFITRLTPGLRIGYDSEPLAVLLDYETSFELYAENSEFNNVGDNQRGALILRYAPDRRLTLGLVASFVYSLQNPGRILVQPAPPETPPAPTSPQAPPAPAGSAADPQGEVVFVDIGREEVHSFSVSPSLTYALDLRTTLGAHYNFTYLDVENDPAQTSHTVGASIDREMTRLFTANARYTFKLFEADDPDGDGTSTSTSHAVTIGGRYWLTERLQVYGRAGPNYIDAEEDDLTLEAAAGFAYTLQNGAIQLSYSRTQALVAGDVGAREVDRVVATLSYQPTRRLGLFVSPNATFINRDEEEDEVQYGVVAGLSYRLAERITLGARYEFIIQEVGSSEVTNNIFWVGVTFADTFRLD